MMLTAGDSAKSDYVHLMAWRTGIPSIYGTVEIAVDTGTRILRNEVPGKDIPATIEFLEKHETPNMHFPFGLQTIVVSLKPADKVFLLKELNTNLQRNKKMTTPP